jgi:hypothetical protein
MSDFEVRSEEDVLPPRPFLTLIGAVVVIAFFWVAVAWVILDAREDAVRPGRRFPEREVTRKDVVSGIEQTLIEVRDHGAELAARKRAQLDGFGWVDREAGVVHIPIDEAIGILAGESP